MRPEIAGALARLQSRIRRYVLLEGIALALVVVGLAFWISLSVDYWLELSRGLRRAIALLALVATVGALVWYLLLRLARGFHNRALALVLERRFPELNDRLITAVELAGGAEPLPALTSSMLGRTIDEAADVLRRLELREVFNARPLVRAAGLAIVLVFSVLGFGLVNAEVFQTWYRRNLLFDDGLYRRETELAIYVLAEPGERQAEFRDGLYKHPRGADLALVAEVVEGKVVPREVHYTYRNRGHSGGGDGYMTRVGERQFRQKLAGLKDSVNLWVRGGDFSTRGPLVVEIVDAPQIDRLSLECLYPAHTGLNLRDPASQEPVRDTLQVIGSQVSLPAGTDFVLTGRANKALLGVLVETDLFDVRITLQGAQARLARGLAGHEAAWVALPGAEARLSGDGRDFRLPFKLQVAEPAAGQSLEPAWPIALPPDAVLRFTLHDADDVISAEPARLAVSSIRDEPPQVDLRLKGIGTSITRQATIPFVGQMRDLQDGTKVYGLSDDYGVVEARFEYRVEGGKEEAPEGFRSRPFENPPRGRREVPVSERFPVLELNLAVGQRLLLKAVAVDGDQLTGPHQASSTPYNFQIVSDDELIALVAIKELNLRRRFEQILEEVKSTRKDLILHRARLDEVKDLLPRNPAELAPAQAERRSVAHLGAAAAADRAISGIRKNANETQSIEEEFRDVRDELDNNAVPDLKTLLNRIEQGILSPLHLINTVDYNECDDLLVVLRAALDQPDAPFGPLDAAVDQLGTTIEHLEAVLAQMLKNEDYHKMLELLRGIIQDQEELKKQTESQRKKKLIEGLK